MTWRIEDDGQAGWALRKLAGVRAEIERHTQNHKAERLRLDEWLAATLAPLQTDQAHWEDLLIDYRNQLEARDPNLRATYRLPDGDIVRRKGRKRIIQDDFEKLYVWLKEHHPDWFRVDVLKSKLHEVPVKDGKLVTEDGEVIPGAHVEYGEVEITVTTRPAGDVTD